MSTATMSPPKRTAARKNCSIPANCSNETSVTSPDANAARFPKSNFTIHTPKNAALIQLNNLKDDATWEEIFYWLEIRQSLQQSMWEANQGMGYTQEEVEAEVKSWFK